MINKEQFSIYLWLSPVYFVSVGVLYLWGYWATFDLNIFEYVGLSDVVKVAIIPVGSVFIFILIGFAVGELTVSDMFPEGEGKETRVGIFLNKNKGVLISLFSFLLLVLVFYPSPEKWRVLPIVLLIPIYFVLKKAGFLREINNDSARSLVISAIVALPLFSLAQGKLNAQKILDDESYRYTKAEWSNKDMKYLGHASKYVFFLSVDNQELVIARDEDVSPLKLLEFRRVKKQPAVEKEPNE